MASPALSDLAMKDKPAIVTRVLMASAPPLQSKFSSAEQRGGTEPNVLTVSKELIRVRTAIASVLSPSKNSWTG